jgi:hypothetical protein
MCRYSEDNSIKNFSNETDQMDVLQLSREGIEIVSIFICEAMGEFRIDKALASKVLAWSSPLLLL